MCTANKYECTESELLENTKRFGKPTFQSLFQELDTETEASSQKCFQISCRSDSDECYPQYYLSTSHSCEFIMDHMGTLYLEGKKIKMFIDGIELTVIVETQAECKEFIRSPRY